ncbi:unnamed protein product [Colias eurytheme]|nr:unnamed protein product [Colias eurytheme]
MPGVASVRSMIVLHRRVTKVGSAPVFTKLRLVVNKYSTRSLPLLLPVGIPHRGWCALQSVPAISSRPSPAQYSTSLANSRGGGSSSAGMYVEAITMLGL